MRKNTEYKVYQFDFGNKFKKIVSYFYMTCANLGIVLISGFVWLFLAGRISNNIKDGIFKSILSYTAFICFLAVSAYFIALIFFPKKIILTDEGIKVRRNTLPHITLTRGLNDYIKYSEIKLCKIYECEDHNWHGKELIFVMFNGDSVVEIFDKHHKDFYIPVENAEEFVDEVNKRIEIAKSSDS